MVIVVEIEYCESRPNTNDIFLVSRDYGISPHYDEGMFVRRLHVDYRNKEEMEYYRNDSYTQFFSGTE